MSTVYPTLLSTDFIYLRHLNEKKEASSLFFLLHLRKPARNQSLGNKEPKNLKPRRMSGPDVWYVFLDAVHLDLDMDEPSL